jgi:hypothetical protein
MDQHQATEFVIREVGRHHQKNDIIQKLCETTGMNWGQAEKFVSQVVAEHGGEIATKQSPLVLLLGTVFVLVGIGLSLFIVYETLRGTVIIFLNLPIPFLGNFVFFIAGLSMIAGGIRGMWDTIVRIWNG